ncbi:MAG: DUF5123 domain-containing protein [Bacteroidales bacterium]|nr:DUF5123 domain-containing protein [Bacteroidales bacterium]MDT8373373.1 DUF5123 domain-containing protein [Bacteroidales bacterium]
MKKTLRNIVFFIGAFSLLLFSACEEKIDPIIEELDFTRAFTPVGLTAQISNVTMVTLAWSEEKNVDHYLVEIYEGIAFAPASLLVTSEVEAGVTTYAYDLPAGDTQFAARVKSVSSLDGVTESKWATVEFRSAPENLFANYFSEMTGLGSCTVRWKPGAIATALVFVDGGNEVSYPLTAGEIAAGKKELTGIANADYEIRLVNDTFVRGRTNLVIEGDVLLPAGGDLAAAIAAMAPGGVLVLTNGADYPLVETDTIRSSIKIRGLLPDNLPTIYLMTGGGNHIFDVDPLMTFSDYVIFENVDISCYYDDAGTARNRGVFDVEGSPVSLGSLIFNNCIVRNSGRSVVRLRGNAEGQVINNVEFNNCVMYDFAFDSHYGMLNPNNATASMVNIKFMDCTIYNIRGGIVNYGSGFGCESIVVDNCTFDQVMMDASSGRWLIDFGTSGVNTGTITVSDCILGLSSEKANGIRPRTMTLSVTGSYAAADFVDVDGVFKAALIPYAGTSTALWTDPVNGDFTFLDIHFEGAGSAGAPRWMP